jgi:hypothetical protein
MENTDAYQTAFDPCLTYCASKPFIAQHGYHPDNPSEFIYANVTASIELRDFMPAYCLNHCGAAVGTQFTSTFKDYCESNLVSTQKKTFTKDSSLATRVFPPTGTSGSYTTITTATRVFTHNRPSKSNTTIITATTVFTHSRPSKLDTTIITATIFVTATATLIPPPEQEKKSTLGIGVWVEIVGAIIALLTLLFMMYVRWKPESAVVVRFKRFRTRKQPSEGVGVNPVNLGPLTAP